jgi:hypothetical protein
MWLINTSTYRLEMFSSSKSISSYAILSHTWGDEKDEVTFKEMTPDVESSPTAAKPGFVKIKMTCIKARTEHDLKYAWVDTCCIDKSSSAELTEAINSMCKWYQRAVVCFVFLKDLIPETDLDPETGTFENCSWFRRGWTLQELIAPHHIRFFDKTWNYYGDKQKLGGEIARISGISEDVLMGKQPLADVPVAVRMSWAAMRETAREEDIAYCLLGIFDVNMPMLYGEGEKAFIRLQEEIIKESPDMSIFAWKGSTDVDYSGLLARSPAEFKDAGGLVTSLPELFSADFSITNRGLRFNVPLVWVSSTGHCILLVNHGEEGELSAGVYLRQVGPDLFVRALPRLASHWDLWDSNTTKSVGLIQVVKTLSTEQAASIKRRVTYLRKPGALGLPDFLPSKVEPAGCWDPWQRMLFAGHTGVFLGYMEFDRTDEFEPFALVCRFDSTRRQEPWRYALVNDYSWTRIQPRYHEHYNYLSEAFFRPHWLPEQSLYLRHLHDESKPEGVILSIGSTGLGSPESLEFQSVEISVVDK